SRISDIRRLAGLGGQFSSQPVLKPGGDLRPQLPRTACGDNETPTSTILPRRFDNAIDTCSELAEMRAAPVNLSAIGAATKIFIVNPSERLEPVEDFLFRDRSQMRVTMQAAREGQNHLAQIEAADDFDGLLFRI